MDPWTDPGTVPVRSVVLEPLVHWIEQNWALRGDLRLLDYGCGDMLLARRLPTSFQVDGYDTSSAAREAAQEASSHFGSPGLIFVDPSDIPAATYDGIVLSSVLQYLPDLEAVQVLLGDLRTWLGDTGAVGVVATDVVPVGSRRLHDAADLTTHLVHRLGLRRTIPALARSVRRSPGDLLEIDEAALRSAAAPAGMLVLRLDENLSPLRRRTSYRFVPR